MTILDYPIRVDHEAERITTHNGGASLDFNGNEAQRREAMRFYEQAPKMAALLKRLDSANGFDATSTAFMGAVRNALRDAGVLS